MGFTSLAHHIDIDWLREAYRRTRKDGAVGVDGQTARTTQRTWRTTSSRCWTEPSPARTRHRRCGGCISPRPARRPKRGRIGIPTFEDKVLQRAVVMVLEAVYEQDFLDCSYGFRPGRSAHQALDSLWQQTMAMGGGWIVGRRHPKVFRHSGSRPPAGLAQAAGTGRGAAATDRQMAQRGRAGRRDASRIRKRARPQGGVISARSCRTSTCTMCWTNGSSGRSNRAERAMRF